MKPESTSEQLLYNTVKLDTLNGSSGTGFFFNFDLGEEIAPVLVTNKHVINNNPHETMHFLLHLQDEDGNDSGQNVDVIYSAEWYFHSICDLCFTLTQPLFLEVQEKTGKKVMYRAIDESMIYDADKLKDLDALESVLMVGYPVGLWDRLHNYPLFRTGFTASHPGYDFNEKSIGLVDIACFPGSSGSPIFIFEKSNYTDKHGNAHFGGSRLIFLGVQFAGPTIGVNGDIIFVDVATQKKPIACSQTMVNLGYYVKSYELLEFKSVIEKIVKAP